MPEINIDKVCFIILRARVLDAKVVPIEPDPGSNPADDGGLEILEDLPGDLTVQELKLAIDDLNEDEQIELVALAWVGRGSYDADGWGEAVAEARRTHNERTTAEYLMGMPLLSDFLLEGLAAFGHSCDE